MKKFIFGFLIGSVLFGTAGALAAELDIKVSSLPIKFVSNGVDKTPVNNLYNNSYASFVYNGNVYIPIGLAADLSGQPFNYNSQTQTVIIGGNQQNSKFLTDERPYYISRGSYEINKPVLMGGQEFTKNIWFTTFAKDSFAYNLNGKFKELETIVGLRDGKNTAGVNLSILGDGKELWSGSLEAGGLPKKLNLDVTGVLKLEFNFNSELVFTSDAVIANPILK
ncbi:NPCBM/NEW2 domain-containing protein [Brevibacillus borstelensis]|uniref:NPCBM/NEW2 domain-containing protein n=1 Tax=Brevibacillus borstelensis TaxID=45462 RepID=UPI00203B2B07|nr:NPCBM/NEW2 domain-containing protein [Brevibacillus borstelensis]MCM3560607.1 NPCBM/NEW2 domain-containing protein [Brevibacillus borstelensis]